MMQSSIISNDPEINALAEEALESMQTMGAVGLKVMMQYGAVLFKTAKERLDEIGGGRERWAVIYLI